MFIILLFHELLPLNSGVCSAGDLRSRYLDNTRSSGDPCGFPNARIGIELGHVDSVNINYFPLTSHATILRD
jgi:hypothetical protein